MQTYIVLGLVVVAAGYAGYVLLRRIGFWGAPQCGCGCGCAGCGPALTRPDEHSPQPVADHSRDGAPLACAGCSSGGLCGRAGAGSKAASPLSPDAAGQVTDNDCKDQQ